MAVIKNTTDYIDQQFYYQLKEMLLQMKLEGQAKKEQPLFNIFPVKKTSNQATVDFPELND